MNSTQETIQAILGPDGQLVLKHQSRLPPGPVEVMIRVAAPTAGKRGLADVVQEIGAEQRRRGFPGRSAADLRAEEEVRQAEDAERDRELDAVRSTLSSKRP